MTRRLFVIVLLLLVGAVGAAVYTLRIEAIRVTGTQIVSPEAVKRASGLGIGERILWVRLSPATRRIEQLPQVASASITRSLPHTVVITIRERMPVAHLNGRPDLATDESGHVFPVDPAERLPVLDGWHRPGKPGKIDAPLDDVSRYVLYAFARFPRTIRERTAEITVGPPFSLVLTDGTQVRFGRLTDLERKARAAKAVLDLERGKKLGYVDVRAPSVPVSGPRRAATPSPAPAP
jgi:cell division protein FtsQ